MNVDACTVSESFNVRSRCFMHLSLLAKYLVSAKGVVRCLKMGGSLQAHRCIMVSARTSLPIMLLLLISECVDVQSGCFMPASLAYYFISASFKLTEGRCYRQYPHCRKLIDYAGSVCLNINLGALITLATFQVLLGFVVLVRWSSIL
jgi:hypothetical protein